MAKVSNIFVDRGASFNEVIDLKNDDGSEFLLSGYTFDGYAKKHQDSEVSIPFTFDIDYTTNNITFSLNPTQTSELSIMTYIFLVNIINISTGDTTRVVSGNMIVSI